MNKININPKEYEELFENFDSLKSILYISNDIYFNEYEMDETSGIQILDLKTEIPEGQKKKMFIKVKFTDYTPMHVEFLLTMRDEENKKQQHLKFMEENADVEVGAGVTANYYFKAYHTPVQY